MDSYKHSASTYGRINTICPKPAQQTPWTLFNCHNLLNVASIPQRTDRILTCLTFPSRKNKKHGHETHHTQPQCRTAKNAPQVVMGQSSGHSARWSNTFTSSSLGGLLQPERTQPFPGEAPLACGNSSASALSSGNETFSESFSAIWSQTCRTATEPPWTSTTNFFPCPEAFTSKSPWHDKSLDRTVIAHGARSAVETLAFVGLAAFAFAATCSYFCSLSTYTLSCVLVKLSRKFFLLNSWLVFTYKTVWYCHSLYHLSQWLVPLQVFWRRASSPPSHGAPQSASPQTFPQVWRSKKFWNQNVWKTLKYVPAMCFSSCWPWQTVLLHSAFMSVDLFFENLRKQQGHGCVAFEHRHMQPLWNAPEGPDLTKADNRIQTKSQAMMKCNFHSHLRIAAVCS